MSIKTLTEILGLSLELKDYEDRVQKRYDYIQEQLKKDPDFVAYDYLEYWHGRADIHYIIDKYVIDTKGNYYQLKGDVWTLARTKHDEGYKEKNINMGNDKYRMFQTHRAIVTTFIPKYEHLKDIPYWKLEANHKDGVKENNNFINLEWMTKAENNTHAVELGSQLSGLSDPNTIPYLATIIMEGPYKGQQFVLAGTAAFEKEGISRSSVRNQTEGKYRAIAGCTWEVISKEDAVMYSQGTPDGFMDFLKANTSLSDPKVKPALGVVQDGKYKGHHFCLYGSKHISENGFGQAYVSGSAKRNKVYKGVLWKYITQEEASNYPRGLDREIYDTL
ncbi:putative HNH endonuclease [Aeromonas phage AVP1]|nr:putative HNH endonuclease [Aeromonas phage AVP1]